MKLLQMNKGTRKKFDFLIAANIYSLKNNPLLSELDVECILYDIKKKINSKITKKIKK